MKGFHNHKPSCLMLPTTARVFFFVVAPFCSCPASLVSRKFFAVRPGCAKCFFCLLRSVGRRDLSAGPEQKKNHPGCFFFLLRPRGKAGEGEAPCRHGARAKKKKKTPRVFFFAAAPAKGKGRRSPVGRRPGARAKKQHHPGCFFFFAPAPGKGRGRRSPVGRRHGARAKKKTPPSCFFFLLWPRAGSQRGVSFPCLSPGPEQKKHTLGGVFLLWPRAGAQRGFSFPCLSPGPQQKKTTLGGVFFLSGPVPARGFSFPCLSPGPEQKKTHPGWCFFFCCGPARTLTHSLTAGLGGDASLSPGWCLFVFAAAPPGPGWCFFFFAVALPGRSLTHCGLGRFRQGPGGVFFCCGPAGSF